LQLLVIFSRREAPAVTCNIPALKKIAVEEIVVIAIFSSGGTRWAAAVPLPYAIFSSTRTADSDIS
jgi:hypothetical protein